MQRADVSETDRDLEGTGLSRPKGAENPEPPPSSSKQQEETDTEEIMESAQSVRPNELQTSAGLTAELHSEKNTLLII